MDTNAWNEFPGWQFGVRQAPIRRCHAGNSVLPFNAPGVAARGHQGKSLHQPVPADMFLQCLLPERAETAAVFDGGRWALDCDLNHVPLLKLEKVAATATGEMVLTCRRSSA